MRSSSNANVWSAELAERTAGLGGSLPFTWKISLLATAVVAPLAIMAFAPGHGPELVMSHVRVPDLVELPPGKFRYRASGEFTRDGKPTTAPVMTVIIKRTLTVMRHQITAADYRRCVEAEACPMGDRDATASDRPCGSRSAR